MSSVKALNQLQSVKIGGVKHDVCRVPILKIWDVVGDYITAEKVRKIKAVALAFDDPQRGNYIREEADKMPDGIDLEVQAVAMCATGVMPDKVTAQLIAEGMRLAGGTLTADDIAGMMDQDGIADALRAALGTEKKSASPAVNSCELASPITDGTLK